ncbi:hypothetical protein Tco_1377368 [Tanacetum coccineum]
MTVMGKLGAVSDASSINTQTCNPMSVMEGGPSEDYQELSKVGYSYFGGSKVVISGKEGYLPEFQNMITTCVACQKVKATQGLLYLPSANHEERGLLDADDDDDA